MALQTPVFHGRLAEMCPRFGRPVHEGAALLYCYGRRVIAAAVRKRTHRCV